MESEKMNLDDSQWYLNRELTWLLFNKRVLQEGMDERNPLLERVFFFSVIGSNFDEFFMKRIGGLKQQLGAGVRTLSVDGRLPEEQLEACSAKVREILDTHQELEGKLLALLREEGIVYQRYSELNRDTQGRMDCYFHENIFPLLTPQGIDPAHPFPFISNLSINLLVLTAENEESPVHLNRIKVPTGIGVPRFIRCGAQGENRFITFEDLVANNLGSLFPNMLIKGVYQFRVTRNAITEPHTEQASDLLSMIETALRDRKFADIVRLEVEENIPPLYRGRLAAELGIDEEKDVYEVKGLLASRDFTELWKLDRPDLRYPPHKPVDHPFLMDNSTSVFHIIRERQSLLLMHPYESFDTSVERFLKETSRDPKVLAVKMTLYRTGSESRIIRYLIDAAQNGKQVAVVVELQARFDESANINWAEELEEAGIHVTYGVVGLKTHSKIILVVRRDFNGLKRYMHIGTGNYHAGTARGYHDLGVLTCDPELGEDLSNLFNYLTTGYAPSRKYVKILPCPSVLKKSLLAKIKREIAHHAENGNGLIQFKCNALEDKDITRALYQASQAGVKIQLIIRDSCRLRPGIPGLSENVSVVSVVGRFLEHARIYYFHNNGDEEYFIGSADLMKRNLESRVEVVTPVAEPAHRRILREILDLQLTNQRSTWDMQSDGEYIQRRGPAGDDDKTVHTIMIEMAEKLVERQLDENGQKKKGKLKRK